MVRLPLPQRLSSHLSSRSNASTPGQSRSTSPMRTPDVKPLVLKVSVLRVSEPCCPWLWSLTVVNSADSYCVNVQGRNLAAKDRGGTSDPVSIPSKNSNEPTGEGPGISTHNSANSVLTSLTVFDSHIRRSQTIDAYHIQDIKPRVECDL
jgi:putative hemolysin